MNFITKERVLSMTRLLPALTTGLLLLLTVSAYAAAPGITGPSFDLTARPSFITQPDGSPLLVVTIVTTDPMYLRQPFVITSQFKKEPNDAKWNPTACSATW